MLDAAPSNPPAARHDFGHWLLGQTFRTDAIGDLARSAARDPGFPRDGTPDTVSCRLNTLGADGIMHAALEDAALDWSCSD